jgi:hypothetical protein
MNNVSHLSHGSNESYSVGVLCTEVRSPANGCHNPWPCATARNMMFLEARIRDILRYLKHGSRRIMGSWCVAVVDISDAVSRPVIPIATLF